MLGILRVGLSEHQAASLDYVQALPDHGDNGAAGHVLAKARVERPAGEIGIVLLQ